MKEIIIGENQAGQRFDKYLAKFLNEAPKSFIYKMLRKKNITLNGKKADGSEKLKEKDVVRLFLAEETIDKFSKVKFEGRHTRLSVIYEDKNIAVINKPSGMLSQKASVRDVSLVEYLTGYLLESGQMTEEEFRSFHPGICNRLDRNTSGIVIAGKTLAGLQGMNEAFKQRSLKKEYLALVDGEITSGAYLKGYLHKDEKCNKVVVEKEPFEDSLPIETEYEPVAGNGGITLLKIHLITGRSHQIRSHLASIGHPVIGDGKYGSRQKNQLFCGKYGVRSQLLHAYQLTMPEMKGELKYLSHKVFTAPIPLELKRVLKGEHIEESIHE